MNSSLMVISYAANGNGAAEASFTFQVQDDGGTANGGVNLDQSANTITINVTSVNDAPSGADNTITTNEDTSHFFTAAEFLLSFPTRRSSDLLAAVEITTVPGAGTGTLTDNGIAVTAG